METRYRHIEMDDGGVPRISGTRTKVIELIVEQRAYGWSAEELHSEHPHLTLGAIHSALAYYYDHREDLDRDVERRFERAEKLQQEQTDSPLMQRLREEKSRRR